MASDKIEIFGKSYYFQKTTGGASANPQIRVLEILQGLVGSPSGVVASASYRVVSASDLNALPSTTSEF